jgi:hypothetical protein
MEKPTEQRADERGADSGAAHGSANPSDCEHDWKEEYYGTRCTKCQTFYAFGCEPWAADDDALGQLQAMNTHGDDLRDAGIEPLSDSPNAQRSHAGPLASDLNLDAPPALAAAFC